MKVLDNTTDCSVQTDQEVDDMTWIKVFAFGFDQTYVVRDGQIPASHFTMNHDKAETLDGGTVKLIRDPSRHSFRVFAAR